MLIFFQIGIPIVLLLCALLLFVGNYFYTFALHAKAKKTIYTTVRVFEEPKEPTPKELDLQADKDWLLTSSTDVYIQAGVLKLHAYQYLNEQASHTYAIVVHGYRDQGIAMAPYVRHFSELGMHALVPDLRGHGKSEGNAIGMGWPDHYDVLKWIDFILMKDPHAQIILFGISMGAATVMMASGEVLPKNVKCIIEDCGYTSIYDQFALQLKNTYHLPPFPIIHVTSLITKLRAGYFFSEGNALNQVKKSTTPILFIHGDSDTFVPFSMHAPLYEATTCEKERLVIKGADHVQSATLDPVTYWNQIASFTQKYIV